MKIRNDWIVFILPLLFLGLLSLFYYKVVLQGVFYCCDNLLITLPAKQLLVEELRNGRFPFWNPFILSGTPYLADLNIAPLYPGNIVFFFLPLFRALTLLSLAHIAFLLFGTYWCARKLKLSPWSSTLAAVIFGFSGTIVTYTNNFPMLTVASWLPWIMGSVIAYSEEHSTKWLRISIIFASLQIISGHPQLTYITWLLIGAYAFVFFKGSIISRIISIFIIAFASGLLCGFQLVPFLELVMKSTRIGNGIEYATFGSLPILSVIRLLLPSLTGNFSTGTEIWQGGSVYGYIGFLPLVSLFFYKKIKDKKLQFIAGAGLLSLIVSFGKYSPLYWFFSFFVPGVRLFRVPAHSLLTYTFCIALISGYLLPELIHSTAINKLKANVLASVSTLTGILLMIFPLSTVLYIASHLPHYGVKVTQKLTAIGLYGLSSLLTEIGINIVFNGISVWLFLSPYGKRLFGRHIHVALLVFLFVDVFLWNGRGILTIPNKQAQYFLQEINGTAQKIKSYVGDMNRLYVDFSTYGSHYKKGAGQATYEEETRWQTATLRPNLSQFSGLRAIEGYSSLIQKSYQDYFDSTIADPTGIHVSTDDTEGLDWLAVSHIVVLSSDITDESTGSGVVSVTGTPLSLLTRPSAHSLVSLYSNGSWTSLLDCQNQPDTIRCSVDSSASGSVVISMNTYPGWRAFVDKKEVPVTVLKKTIPSFFLTSGHHTIEYRFDSVSVRIGVVVSIAGIGTFFALGFIKRKKIRNQFR